MYFTAVSTMIVLQVIVLSLALMISGDNDFRPDYQYHLLAKGWFKLHRVPAIWQDARMLCDFEGAVLASPLDVHMSEVMYSIINKTEPTPFGVYTGFHNTISPSKYHSIEGVPLTMLGNNEMFSEEYNSTPSCMRLDPQAGLVPGSCNDSLPFMCYKKKTTELKMTECGTVDQGYKLDKRTGHCYKFHVDVLTWPLAFLRCDAEGGYLAIANSGVEAGVFKEMFDKHPDASIIGKHKGAIHLGFYDWNNNGLWRTIHGERLEEAGFREWSNGQPDNYGSGTGPGQHCGSMFRSGKLDDVYCTHMTAFICERDPSSASTTNYQ